MGNRRRRPTSPLFFRRCVCSPVKCLCLLESCGPQPWCGGVARTAGSLWTHSYCIRMRSSGRPAQSTTRFPRWGGGWAGSLRAHSSPDGTKLPRVVRPQSDGCGRVSLSSRQREGRGPAPPRRWPAPFMPRPTGRRLRRPRRTPPYVPLAARCAPSPAPLCRLGGRCLPRPPPHRGAPPSLPRSPSPTLSTPHSSALLGWPPWLPDPPGPPRRRPRRQPPPSG